MVVNLCQVWILRKYYQFVSSNHNFFTSRYDYQISWHDYPTNLWFNSAFLFLLKVLYYCIFALLPKNFHLKTKSHLCWPKTHNFKKFVCWRNHMLDYQLISTLFIFISIYFDTPALDLKTTLSMLNIPLPPQIFFS